MLMLKPSVIQFIQVTLGFLAGQLHRLDHPFAHDQFASDLTILMRGHGQQ
jgi:hypothetical protein